ncbi:ABC transporter ATP-binding protein [Fodinicola acaciae]|uniref:ABC transporter ATP-binding protein n=1 Tax=Fodinicola acaciae TaxID=2681555 RepID=UPI0013D89AEA|nr:ABC transporter ATP-binding protein [Fodinicola acaciae]
MADTATTSTAATAAPDADDRPAIGLVGVSKTYASAHGDVAAVRQLDLQVGQGEFFSLLGPSGCGKTTTMRMVAGFEVPSTGSVHLYGEDVTALPAHRRDVNMVFQSYALFPHMTIFENIAFGLRRKRIDRAEITRRVKDIVELTELTGMEKRRPGQLSGGQQQRVALARALVNRPRALLLDEPLGALDLKLRQSMQIELKRIQREVGITFVYVTHDQGEALTMSDRIAVMNTGVVEQLGDPRDIYERPATRFVAGFIGTSNLLSGPVAKVVDGHAVIEPGDGQRIVVESPHATVGEQVELTVRPEKVRLSATEPDGDFSRIRGEVTEVVYLGTSTNYAVRTESGADMTVFLQNGSDASDVAERGDRVWLCWQPRHSYALAVQS